MRLCIMLLASLLATTAHAAAEPRTACDSPPVPAYPTTIGDPVVQTQTVSNWTPPPSLGWNGASPTLLVAVAGRLRESAGTEALLSRFGAISRQRGIRYWSVTDQAWLPLITDAFAVTNATAGSRREDFVPAEMQPGAVLYSSERDSRSSRAVTYQMRVLARTPDRVVVSVVNASPVRAFLVTLFAPGDLQTTYFLDRLGPDTWGYCGLWGITTGLLTGGHAASSINRAVALYRHFAGIPTDREPPAAR
jgi:hypothetical protein